MINTPMKKNVKKIIINIPSDQILKRIKSTPALSSLLKNQSLVVGDNIEYVSHYSFSSINRLYPIIGCTVTEIKP